MADDVRLLRDRDEERRLLIDGIRQARRDTEVVRLLEAGCGHYWALSPEDVPLHITGVDTDADALRIRRERYGDLADEILGDLLTVDLPPESFDVAYCSFVLEHVKGAEHALDRMREALRAGGRLIIRVPDGDSVFGFVAKHSPHRSHVFYKRYIEGHRDAGKPGHAPYPTVYDPVVSLRGIRDWAARNDMEIVTEYGSNFYLNVFGRLRPLAQLAVKVVSWLSRGRLSATHNNIGFVMVKKD